MNYKYILKTLSIAVLIFTSVIALIIGLLFFISNRGVKVIKEANVTFDSRIPSDYMFFFKNKNVLIKGSFNSRKRNSISEYYYNNNYKIFLYRLTTFKSNFIKNIKEEYISTELTPFVDYLEAIHDSLTNISYPVRFVFKSGFPDRANMAYLTLSGARCEVLEKNDTIAYYHLDLNNFSIRYTANGNIDLYGNVANSRLNSKIPCELMFLRRANDIYLVIAFVTTKDMLLNKGLLHKVIFDN